MTRGTVYVVTVLCVAEVLTMTGVSTYAALLPVLRSEWQATNTLAGGISGAFFAGYMLAVPALVSLTDRVAPRRVYVSGCVALAAGAAAFSVATRPLHAVLAHAVLGAGLAGTYMPGLKELSDRISGPKQSRAIAFYTSTFGLGNSLSLWLAGALHSHAGWRVAFLAAAAGPVGAAALMLAGLSRRPTPGTPAPHARLFRDVLGNPGIRGYLVTYAAHCWELFAVRSWMVAFLTYAAPGSAIAPASIAAAINLLGPPASISGNEVAMGRRVVVVRTIMAAGAVLACATGLVANRGAVVVVLVLSAYVLAIMADSAAMTAGLVEVTPAGTRGTAMGVYSFVGFGGALIGPIVFGALLDAGGGESLHRAWILAFSGLAAVSLAGVTALRAARGSGL